MKRVLFPSGVLTASLLMSPLSFAVSPYSDALIVPPYIKDVRGMIERASNLHAWRIIEEKPGELSLELRYERTRTLVYAKAHYSVQDVRFELKDASRYGCRRNSMDNCTVDQADIKRWMVTLRRAVALDMLYAAIQDAGGPNLRPAGLRGGPTPDDNDP